MKKDLAIAYKVLAYLGMDDHTYTHLSTRCQSIEGFYIQPFGLRFDEVTEENLLSVSLEGEVIDGQEYQYNKTGYVIHGSIYKARGDINAIFHLHTTNITAVSSIEEGLLPINQWALHFYDRISYHKYDSLALAEHYGERLAQDLGKNNVMLMRNHGCLICAKSLHEALFYAYHLEKACAAQIATLSMGKSIVVPDTQTCKKASADLLSFEKDLGMRDWISWKRIIQNPK
ncbi:Class II aldolase/adducin domain protein [Candidatus Cyrtobacter comes]|uniref:Class II aldolase/adducin domain protein n=1 Tax=Candidatus Cyrtobacter comes TaxID=675776 RepID=A0ABU5L937_9RICK|nr:class II aldolase/adducin family protein [Candidatus Cyrtobacter comes]MDZ5762385.1 Class II aldolase/adducin domain protein [Candidatus Cyrtobacter comes]